MKRPAPILVALVLIALIVYLFIDAPPPLPEEEDTTNQIPIETALKVVAMENATIRAMWTKDIVVAGGPAGFSFGEDWENPEVEKGPLPALFLRKTAANLQKTSVPLSLFLGSDAPINPDNKFQGRQVEAFSAIKQERIPQYFYAEDTKQYTAMFPDPASPQGCVDCHNEHPDSPKVDWKLNDIMGATTWQYPKESVSVNELTRMVSALRQSFRGPYQAYLDKTATFSMKPEVGEKWPRDGYFLPSADAFMAEFSRRASAHTLDVLLCFEEFNCGSQLHEDVDGAE
jgi:adenylate cyclase